MGRLHTLTALDRAWQMTPRTVRAALVGLSRRLQRTGGADRTVAALLLGYAAIWTVSTSIARAGIGLQGDMQAIFAQSLEFSLGYIDHPPLINWIVTAWFGVFPVARWSYHLLSYLNAALGMGAVWLAARYVVDSRRRILAVSLLGLTPIFTFQAGIFNHNTVQLSLWPLVALSFFASIERPNLIWSVLFGVASGLAILGKHYAVLIVFACMLAVFLHPRWVDYLRSPRPYLAAAVCVAVLAPHLYWLATHDFTPTRQYVGLSDQADPIKALRYLGAYAGYLAPALLVLWLALPAATRVWMMFGGWPPRRRVVACIALVPVVLPLLVLPLADIGARVPWMYPAFFFAPLAVVAAPGLVIGRRTIAAVLGSVITAAVATAILSPALMIANFVATDPKNTQPVAALAKAATEAWRSRTGRPLTLVGGARPLIWYVSFHSDDHPLVSPSWTRMESPAETAQSWKRNGVLGVCRADDASCLRLFAPFASTVERIELTLPVMFLGMVRAPERYVLFIVPGER